MGNKICQKCDTPLSYYRQDTGEYRELDRYNCRYHGIVDSSRVCGDCGIVKMNQAGCRHRWRWRWWWNHWWR